MSLVVVGGGITGLLAAIVGRRMGLATTIVEAGPRLGGLLASEPLAGHFVDFGTHIPQETGRAEIDEVLFASMNTADWVELGPQRAGNIFSGRLNERSPFPDVGVLGARVRARVLADLIDAALEPAGPAATTAEEALRQRYGSAAVKYVFRPVLEHHLGESLESLEPGAERLFLQRLIVAGATASRRLKVLAELDERVAFTSFEEGSSNRRAWYAIRGGAGRWTEDLVGHWLQEADIRLQTSVTSVEGERTVRRLFLSDSTTIEPDHVVWTAPVIHLLRAAHLDLPGGLVRPRFRRTSLHHLILDKPSATSLHYVTSFDPAVPFFRVTNYDQLQLHSSSATHALTVEFFDDLPEQRGLSDAERVRAALAASELIGADATVLHHLRREIPVGFPIPVLGTTRSTSALADLCKRWDNVHVAGRASGQAFFMGEALSHTWDTVLAALQAG